MPLIKYSQYLSYPDGSPIANAPLLVTLLGGNVAVPLFADKAGTVPLSNPVMTDGDGQAVFHAAPGNYVTDIGGEAHHYAVDSTETDESWPGTYIHVQDTAAATWTVAHHFGAKPAVAVLVADQVVEADVSHSDDQTTVIGFGAPTAGVAYLRR